MSSPLHELEEFDNEASVEDAASEGSPALGRGRRLSFKMNCRPIRIVHRYKQKMSISPHTSKALIHQHVLLWNLLHRTLAAVLLAGHEVDRIYGKGGRPLQYSARGKKCKGTGTVASADVFEAATLG